MKKDNPYRNWTTKEIRQVIKENNEMIRSDDKDIVHFKIEIDKLEKRIKAAAKCKLKHFKDNVLLLKTLDHRKGKSK